MIQTDTPKGIERIQGNSGTSEFRKLFWIGVIKSLSEKNGIRKRKSNIEDNRVKTVKMSTWGIKDRKKKIKDDLSSLNFQQ